MTSVALELFLPEVLLECSGAPEPVVLNAVRNACFDFCRKSLFWRETLDPVSYTRGTAEYPLDAPTGAQIVKVVFVNLDELRIVYPHTDEDAARENPAYATKQGVLLGFTQPAADVVRLFPVPQEDGYFVPTVACAPLRTATSVDARLYNLYLETIKYGALWKLLSQGNQPWADKASAADYEAKFWMGANAAALEANRGNSRASTRVAPVPFA